MCGKLRKLEIDAQVIKVMIAAMSVTHRDSTIRL